VRADRPALLYVVHSLRPGGAERLVVEMSHAFREDFAVQVICLDCPGTWARVVRGAGIPVYCLWRQPGFDAALIMKLALAYQRTGAEIVHAHQCTAWTYAALARLLYPRPRLIFQEHGRFFPEIDSARRRLVNRIVIRRLTHRFVAVSEETRARLHRHEGLKLEDIQVIHNGVPLAPPLSTMERADLRSELGLQPDEFVVGTAGRFDPIKNLPMLVGGLARARKEVPKVRGLLVGDGPQFTEIRALLDRAGLGRCILTPGFRTDARRLVECMDLFALCSFSEGTSMALLEATAAGVPVVVTRVGGNPEVVLDGQTGWVIGSGDEDAFTSVIVKAATCAEVAHRFGRAGQARFEERFALKRMIAAYRKQYREVLAIKPNASYTSSTQPP
jgi:glycosyltransferase involved in cell wall biosynthesis